MTHAYASDTAVPLELSLTRIFSVIFYYHFAFLAISILLNDFGDEILAIAEEEGAARASYALKLLQSEGELTIASTGKDATTGNLVTQQYRVEGPVMIMLTTTAIEIDEELLNRCLVLSVDEGREQTEAIHRRQRAKRTLEGLRAKHERARLVRLHQNAQRLLRPLAVVNPYAERLTFLADKTRTRRDHEKYLTLIDAIALLHQHQRPVKTMPNLVDRGGRAVEYVEVTAADIAQANAIAHEVLGRSLDELPPQTRRLLGAIVEHVRAQMREHAHGHAVLARLDQHVADLLEHLEVAGAERGVVFPVGQARLRVVDVDPAAVVFLGGFCDVALAHKVATLRQVATCWQVATFPAVAVASLGTAAKGHEVFCGESGNAMKP